MNPAIYQVTTGDIAQAREALERTKQKGALLIRGLRPEINAFKEFTNKFELHFTTHQGAMLGYRDYLDPDDPTIATATTGFEPRLLHMEQGYSPLNPDFIFFFCIHSPKISGETFIVDGEEVYSSLSNELREFASTIIFSHSSTIERKNKHHVHAFLRSVACKSLEEAKTKTEAIAAALHRPGEQWVLEITEKTVYYSYSYPLVRRSVWSDNNIIGGYLRGDASTQVFINGKTISQASTEDLMSFKEIKNAIGQCTYFHKWSDGEMIILDNKRLMHGRNAFNDSQRQIAVRMGMRKNIGH